jgi:hypothetical protein
VTGDEYGPWATCLVVRGVEADRTLLFTFAMVCFACTSDPATPSELADRAFVKPELSTSDPSRIQ